jgi:PhzF family phenazine biosynthesis protein
MAQYAFHQVDVFTRTPLKGNPLAVVIGADDFTTQQMAAFANWTNLSETTFLLKPTDPRADYRVRIFTPRHELPFAGHPTLGSCHVWLASGGQPRSDRIVQECGVGLVELARLDGRLAFAAPPARRRAVEPETLLKIAASLRIAPGEILQSQWLCDPPFWVAVMLRDADAVLALTPDFAAMEGLEIGVIGPHTAGETQFEVRGFAPGAGIPEDPVTGSLNAGLAQWLIEAGLAPRRYVVSQGTALGRAGRVHISADADAIWIGGDVVTCIEGTLTL